jgi:hypothetical protein
VRWWDLVEQLRHCRHYLSGCERFAQQNAIGYAVRRPLIGSSAGHIYHRHLWIDLPGSLRNVPAGELALQMNVGEQRAIFRRFASE